MPAFYEPEKTWLSQSIEFTVGGLGFLAILYYLCGVGLNVVVDKIPRKFEKVMVKTIDYEQYQTPFNYVDAEIHTQLLMEDLVSLSKNPEREYTIIFHDDEAALALPLPGNRIILSSHLINALDSENELSFILAGQLALYQKRVHLRALGRRSLFVFVLASVFGENSALAKSAADMVDLGRLRFSKKQIFEADKYALRLVNKKYKHVYGVMNFLENIKENENKLSHGEYLKVYPSIDERIEGVKDQVFLFGYQSQGVDRSLLDPEIFRKYSF